MPEFTPLTPPQNWVELIKQMDQMGFEPLCLIRIMLFREFYKYFDDPENIVIPSGTVTAAQLKKWLEDQKFKVTDTISTVDGKTRPGFKIEAK